MATDTFDWEPDEDELDEEARLERQHDEEVASGEYYGPPCDCHPTPEQEAP